MTRKLDTPIGIFVIETTNFNGEIKGKLLDLCDQTQTLIKISKYMIIRNMLGGSSRINLYTLLFGLITVKRLYHCCTTKTKAKTKGLQRLMCNILD
ncbi:hypothetical protein PMSD_15515 [Paenibacillus macquariensis subsp. defensor]|nr:hypothetical protein PMSD_15515 [Paenibacillus macquariensis subsp. defensor]